MWNLRPLLLTHGVYVRRHLLLCWIHLVQKRVHFSGEWQIKADMVQKMLLGLMSAVNLLFQDWHDGLQNCIKNIDEDGVA